MLTPREEPPPPPPLAAKASHDGIYMSRETAWQFEQLQRYLRYPVKSQLVAALVRQEYERHFPHA
jgi:hypothetical protein